MIWMTFTAFFLLISSWVTKKLHHTLGILTLICLVFGIFLGFFHQIPSLKVIRVLSQAPLILFLFIDGVRLYFPKIIYYHKEAFRQMTIGYFIQVILGALLAYFVLDLSWMFSCLLSLSLAAIDLKVTPMPIETKKIPPRIAQILNLETSATSILTILLFMIFKERSLPTLIFPILAGFILGIFIIYLMRIALNTYFACRSFLTSSLFVAPFSLFYLCEILHWNGYIGVMILSLTLGHFGRTLCDGLFDFGKKQGRFLFFLFFITFGCQVLEPLAHSWTFEMILYALLSLFIIRLIGVFISFLGSKFHWKTIIFCTFFGPRALLPAALAFLAFPYHIQAYTTIYGTVVLSLILHTLFSFSITYWYRYAVDERWVAEFVPTVSLPN